MQKTTYFHISRNSTNRGIHEVNSIFHTVEKIAQKTFITFADV